MSTAFRVWGVEILPGGGPGPAAVSYRVYLQKSRPGIVPVGERAHGDLLLEQAPRLGLVV